MKNNARFKLDLNHISIGRDQRLMNNEEPIVWHEPILDRYWDVLEAEIDRMRQLDRVADTNYEYRNEEGTPRCTSCNLS